MKHSTMNHVNHDYTIMFFVMILSGFLSTMNVWADKLDDVRFSLNDVYMTLLMSGWMFLFMGLYYKELPITIIGLCLVVLNIWCIRTQFLISTDQYILGMIPHHSMAIHMSRKLLEKETIESKQSKQSRIKEFVKNIIKTQEDEIQFMKQNI